MYNLIRQQRILNGWNCRKFNVSKLIRCANINPLKKAYISTCAPDKQCKIDVSTKHLYEHSFIIRYSCVNLNSSKFDRNSNTLYKVNIIACHTVHNCQLSSQFYQHIVGTSAVHSKINLSCLNTILMVLKTDPSASLKALRPLLTEYLRNDTALNAVLIRNFR